MFDGKTPHWYHFICFFARQRPKTVGDISHFESLRWEDQEKIKAKIGKKWIIDVSVTRATLEEVVFRCFLNDINIYSPLIAVG
jgi:hypothetical protein